MSKTTCMCINVDMGSCDAQVSMRAPNGKWVCIDACLATEIAWLWLLGVPTIECCCGHNKVSGYIAVADEHSERMRELGYFEHAHPRGWSGFWNPRGAPVPQSVVDTYDRRAARSPEIKCQTCDGSGGITPIPGGCSNGEPRTMPLADGRVLPIDR